MEGVKKGNKGLTILVIVLLLACIGMGGYIGYDKYNEAKEKKDVSAGTVWIDDDTTKKTTTEKTEDVFKDDTIKPLYFETKQDNLSKYILVLLPSDDNDGYFRLDKIIIYDTGSEILSEDGYYKIKDNKLVFSVGPNANLEGGRSGEIYHNLGINFTTDSENPSYKIYSTTYGAKELTIGNKTFYNVK